MTGSIDFKEATSFACGTPERNAEKPKETTLTAAIAELQAPTVKRDTKTIPTIGKGSR
ncbi:MAG: hypothetical protein IKV03_06760 [Alphaproteobacteria bacterium]|nr:hypothetical protein [Alphaproteobacteria bacterium]MBR5130900.1 hypothetical protein [Alphaproteobacteria bacterium]